MESKWKSRKVVVVGAGAVGSTFAYALAQRGVAEEIDLIDRNRDFAEGQALDLAHGMAYYPSVQIRSGQEHDYADAQVIVITAGARQEPGESRLALVQKNKAIIESIMEQIALQGSQAIVVVASNPVDILTYVALKQSGWPKARILGSGTVLDSSRFRYLISQHCGVDASNVHAYFLGEHGDSEFPAWSMTHIAGVSIDDYCPLCKKCDSWQQERERIALTVKESAYHIINYKGSTYFAIGMALMRIVSTILQDQKSILPVSTFLDGEYGIKDVCLGVPCVLGQSGVRQIVESPLSLDEKRALSKSAAILQEVLAQLDFK